MKVWYPDLSLVTGELHMPMDEFYRKFARRAAAHYPHYRQDAQQTDQDDTVAWAEHMRQALNLAADDVTNLLNIIEALSGERFGRGEKLTRQ